MNKNTRSRILRKVISAILDSDFSDREMKDISNAFIKSDLLIKEIGERLDSLTAPFAVRNDNSTASKKPKSQNVSSNNSTDLFSLLARARISNNEILDSISIIAPKLVEKINIRRGGTDEDVRELATQLSQNQLDRLLRLLMRRNRDKFPDQDPYLDLISEISQKRNVSK